jgi:hypothetical protein
VLQLSYAAAATAMVGAALYLFLRLRPFLTTTTMLMMSLLLIFGPAFLSFTLASGEDAFFIRRAVGVDGRASDVWLEMAAKIPDFHAVIAAMNFSVALMYIGIIAGIEIVGWLAAERITNLSKASVDWNSQFLRDDAGDSRVLLGVISGLAAFMLFVSFKEDHLATIKQFFAASAEGGDRLDMRLHHAGSPNYLYNVVLGAVAPMLVVWGGLAGWLRRSWLLAFATLALFLAVSIGKVETLSKAPIVFFLVQLMLATFLTQTNRITRRSFLAGTCIVIIVIYFVTRLIVNSPEGLATLEFAYSRVFEAENESLLEYFAAFPRIHPFMWGANIRPLAALMHVHYDRSFSIVAQTWHAGSDPGYTNPSLFIADAWVDFSYAGVIFFSILAGVVCRGIDMLFLARGKTIAAVAVLAATFWGIVVLLTTALNIAFFSGGLLLAPILAAILTATAPRPATVTD